MPDPTYTDWTGTTACPTCGEQAPTGAETGSDGSGTMVVTCGACGYYGSATIEQQENPDV